METGEFVQSELPAGATILDVGCGKGLIARDLMARGFDVTALDAHSDAVDAAKANGVTAILSDFLQYEPQRKFDAVLFARSLHHIHPVEQALLKAKSALTARGVILLDEFGAELVDEHTATFFYGVKSLLFAGEQEPHSRGPQLLAPDMVQSPGDCLKAWRDHHFGKHEIATSEEMLRSLHQHFTVEKNEKVPYVHRYFVDDLSPEQSAALFVWESTLCRQGRIQPFGIRAVGRLAF